MSVINATKTIATSLLALQSIAASSVVVGAGVDVSTKLAGSVSIHFGRRSASAAGSVGVNFRLEASAKALASALGSWFPLAIFTTGFAAVTSSAVTTSSASGQAVVSMSSTTNMAVGNQIYIDNTTIANSEWVRVKSLVASTSITLEEVLANTQGTSSIAYNTPELFQASLDLSGIAALRVVADGSLYTQAFATEAFLTSLDSLLVT